MKTSNKLLLGLFTFVVICILIVNFVLKKQIDTTLKTNVQTEVNAPDSTSTAESDSIAMNKAITNE